MEVVNFYNYRLSTQLHSELYGKKIENNYLKF